MKYRFQSFFKFLSFTLFYILLTPTSSLGAENNHKTVFITGAAGFIGSNFLEFMFNKYESYNFIALDLLTYAGNLNNIPDYIRSSDRFKFYKDSITNFDVVNKLMGESDFVVHFAAESHVDKSISCGYDFFETNVMGTLCMVHSLMNHLSHVDRFIHVSSSEVYGTADYVPMDEEHPLKPKSPYAGSKAGADRLIYAYSSTFDLPIVTIRPFNNYGPKQHTEKMIPRFIAQALSQRPITIHGTGNQKRDWIHTFDVTKAIDIALHIGDFQKIKNQEINLATGIATSVKEMAANILEKLNLPADEYLSFTPDRPGQVDCHFGSFEKAKDLLGWQPIISIDEGISQTIDWYKQHPEYYLIQNDEI